MSIVKAINELSGKEAVTIEDAIRNVELGGDAGYECTEEKTTVFDGTVETSNFWNGGQMSYSLEFQSGFDFTAPTIDVVFNGTEYKDVQLQDFYGTEHYGASYRGGFEFSEYPFTIANREGNDHVLVTQNAGTYTLTVKTLTVSVEVSECFEKAVKSVTAPLMINFMEADADTGNIYFDKTFIEVANAYLKGRPCVLNYNLEGADYSGFFSAAAILDASKTDPERVIFPRGIESIVLYANSDTGRLYGKETDMR